jgi:hypothetical protein
MMLLSEISAGDTFTIKCAAIGGVFTLIFNALRAWTADRAKAKREDIQTEVLRDISRLNNDIRLGQIEQNGKLSTAVAVGSVYHNELLRALKEIPCRATPVLVQQVNQQKPKEKENKIVT